MDTALDSLSAPFQPLVFALLARLLERGVLVKIIQTSRTPEEHAANVANGTSKTSHSKHLPRNLRGVPFDLDADADKADAIDLCPFETWELHGPDKLQWHASDPAFQIIGEEAEKLDLRWGGRWRSPVDPGHCELILSPADRALATHERARHPE